MKRKQQHEVCVRTASGHVACGPVVRAKSQKGSAQSRRNPLRASLQRYWENDARDSTARQVALYVKPFQKLIDAGLVHNLNLEGELYYQDSRVHVAIESRAYRQLRSDEDVLPGTDRIFDVTYTTAKQAALCRQRGNPLYECAHRIRSGVDAATAAKAFVRAIKTHGEKPDRNVLDLWEVMQTLPEDMPSEDRYAYTESLRAQGLLPGRPW